MEMHMEMSSGLPSWLEPAAWIFLAVGAITSAVIALDVFARKPGDARRATSALWPLSALYLGPLALVLYYRYGRVTQSRSDAVVTVRSGLLGGVSSGLAHLVAVPIVVATGLTIAGVDMWAMVAIITVLATLAIFATEYLYFTSADHRIRGARGIAGALVAAALTVLAFDVGMLGWMLVLFFSETMPAPNDIRFTFLMQIGLLLGTITALPMVRWLTRRRIAPQQRLA